MISLLSKIFIKNRYSYKDSTVREKYGILCGLMGIFLNALISAGKIAVGIITGSISILADGLNNVSDAGSSVIGMVGIKLSNKPFDSKHPFGHGRMEYVSGFIVAVLIIVVGVELAISSVKNIINPVDVEINLVSMIILSVSILVKLYMFLYNFRIGKKIDSSGMKATSMDSICDAVSTFAVLICSIVTFFTGVVLDAYAGLLVSLFIIFTGTKTVIETVNLLIGETPDKEFVKEIADFVKSFPIVHGIHDLVIHNYGVGRSMITLHVEIPVNCNIMEAHDCIDNIEHELAKKFRCHAVIHMDPVYTDEPYANQVREAVTNIVKNVNPIFDIHDFRMNEGSTHTNIIFDLVIPHELKNNVAEIVSLITNKIKAVNPTYNCVIDIDFPFVCVEK